MGLLSRYILVQGDADAERTRRGPHVRVEGTARIRGVQAFRAGQVGRLKAGRPSPSDSCRAGVCVFAVVRQGVHAWPALRLVSSCMPLQTNVRGAYPFHWHMVGDASGQMATDNSVYRCGCRQGARSRVLAVLPCDPLPAAVQPAC